MIQTRPLLHIFDCKMDEQLFSGPLLALTTDGVQLQPEAVSFLEHLVEPVVFVSLHGPKRSGKTSLVRSLFDVHEDDAGTEYRKIPIYDSGTY